MFYYAFIWGKFSAKNEGTGSSETLNFKFPGGACPPPPPSPPPPTPSVHASEKFLAMPLLS